MIPAPLIAAYLKDFGGRTNPAAEYAKIPFGMFDRMRLGVFEERAMTHGYSAEERLETAIYRRLPRRKIDAIMAAWRAISVARQDQAEQAEGERILNERMNGPHITVLDLNGSSETIPLDPHSGDLLIGHAPVEFYAKEKRCTHCNIVKPVTEFAKKSKAKDGLQNWCRGCISLSDARNTGVQAEKAATLPVPLATIQDEVNQIQSDMVDVAERLSRILTQSRQQAHIEEANAALRADLKKAQTEASEAWTMAGNLSDSKMEEENAQLMRQLAEQRQLNVALRREIERLRAAH